jgi:hypothetical protein
MSDLPCATKFLLAIPDELGELRPSYGGVVHSTLSVESRGVFVLVLVVLMAALRLWQN